MPVGVYQHKPLSQETKLKLSLLKKGTRNAGSFPKGIVPTTAFKPGQFVNENHFAWKGDEASYSAKHYWVYRKLGRPNECKECGKIEGKFTWANISGEYKRDLTDWKRLCYSCHKIFDLRRLS